MPFRLPHRSDFVKVSKATYFSALFGTVKPEHTPVGGMWEVQRMHIAQEMGWTLEYIDALSEFDLTTLLGMWDGESKAKEHDS